MCVETGLPRITKLTRGLSSRPFLSCYDTALRSRKPFDQGPQTFRGTRFVKLDAVLLLSRVHSDCVMETISSGLGSIHYSRLFEETRILDQARQLSGLLWRQICRIKVAAKRKAGKPAATFKTNPHFFLANFYLHYSMPK